MENTQDQKLYRDVVQKAWEDADFKKELMADPVAAIESVTGVRLNIPAGKRIVVRDQSEESTAYINIPAAKDTDNVELNEEQLELVAGGQSVASFIDVTIYPTFPPIDCFPIKPIVYTKS
ncbi:nitrile hydratase, alpha chain [Kordia sp. SMS9]|uniref:NHLP leader peptide family RiPP precursor n=1 Tax=Kordia sp. SMS9 TaxID=2282170 RepID=UPI000E0E0513|nr:NHLP leader peptide family RiPP precursor [Kordia sp. SMS9]AXG69009.1 nitrile hydratase, alpha chain [Kordia sp. SMS9]